MKQRKIFLHIIITKVPNCVIVKDLLLNTQVITSQYGQYSCIAYYTQNGVETIILYHYKQHNEQFNNDKYMIHGPLICFITVKLK